MVKKLVRMGIACAYLAGVLACGASVAVADGTKDLCAAAKDRVDKDNALAAAVNVVLGRIRFARGDVDCVYPFKLLRYGDADVLVTGAAGPGEVCHGCGADLSAFVLGRTPGRARVVARFANFGSFGTWGNPGQVDAVQLAGHDAIVIEAGGAFQGYFTSNVSFLVFRDGRLDRIAPDLPLSAGDGGAEPDARKTVDVEGAWRIDPSRPDVVRIEYEVAARGRTRRAGAAWRLQGGGLVPDGGSVPPEFKDAGGG